MATFRVCVPIEPVPQETLASRTVHALPDTQLPRGVKLHNDAGDHFAELEIIADDGGTAKLQGIRIVEELLAAIGAWGDVFQVRLSGVRSEAPGVVAIQSHAEALLQRGSLVEAAGLFGRYGDLPDYVRGALELNHLLLLSTRNQTRWLMAAIGLETLANGELGKPETAMDSLTDGQKRQVKKALRDSLLKVGFDDEALIKRLEGSLTQTHKLGVPARIHAYLAKAGVRDVAIREIKEWWSGRNGYAHGSSAQIDVETLGRLVGTFQTALRREAGADPVPQPPK